MAYCRFGRDSDVYVFDVVGGGFECCSCNLILPIMSRTFNSPTAMLEHLIEHIRKGDKVPQSALDELVELP